MKLIATDLDGTLLNSKHEISNENIEALKLASKYGTEITIATGRTYADASTICKNAGICAHIISNNGSLVHSKDGKKLKSDTIDRKYIKEVLNWLYTNEYFFEICTGENLFLLSTAKAILEDDFYKAKLRDSSLSIDALNKMLTLVFSQEGVKLINNLDDIIDADLDYCSITAVSFNKDKLKKGREFFKNHDELSLIVSHEYNFELVNINASKGNSLECLASYLKIPLKDVIAMGDNYNDISMFKKAGISVAMGNAKDDIKKICSYVSMSNDCHGVAYAINEFINKLNIKSYLA
jgi:Cof subfamily protein (haloacid dehalogenase superfamily)